MSKTHAESLREQVDDFLRAALAERDDTIRRKLLGKAAYWHDVAVRAARAERREGTRSSEGSVLNSES